MVPAPHSYGEVSPPNRKVKADTGTQHGGKAVSYQRFQGTTEPQ